MRDRSGILLAIAAVALTSSPGKAEAAAPLAVRLEFSADAACPSEAEFLQRLSSRTAVRVVEAGEALRLSVTLGMGPNGARGELRAEGGTDAREVEARSCTEVTEALALIAALVIERTAREQATHPPVIKPPPPPSRPRAVTSWRRAPRRRVELGVQAVVTRPLALAPLTGAGVSLFVPSSLTWWLSADYARNDLLQSPSHARFGFGALVLGVGSPQLRLGAEWRVAVGLAAQGAFLTAEGVNVDVPSSARRSYWAGGLLGRADWEVTSHASAFVEVGGFVPLVERRFSTREPYVLVGQTSGIAAELALGLALGL